MNKAVKVGLGIVVGVVAILVGMSVLGDSGATSWENAEQYVVKDVNAYIDAGLRNDQAKLERKYGESLAELGQMIYGNYVMTGEKARIVDIERFSDGCWATVQGACFATISSTTHDECTFYYTYKNGRWQLGQIGAKIFVEGHQTAEVESVRDIPFK